MHFSTSLIFLLVTVGLMAIFILVFWARHFQTKTRRSVLPVVFGFSLIALYPALVVASAMADGVVDCLGRGCGNKVYTLLGQPYHFWINVLIADLLAAFFVSGVTYAIYYFTKHWRTLS